MKEKEKPHNMCSLENIQKIKNIKTENHKQKDAGYQPASFHIQTIYAMINKYMQKFEDGHSIAEYLVIPKYRRKNIGKKVRKIIKQL